MKSFDKKKARWSAEGAIEIHAKILPDTAPMELRTLNHTQPLFKKRNFQGKMPTESSEMNRWQVPPGF